MVSEKTFLLFGPRVSEATKQAMREQLGYEAIPADFGPFGSGAPFCELFPLGKEARTGKPVEELTARLHEKEALLRDAYVIFVESTGEQPDVAESVERVRFGINSLKHFKVKNVTVAMPNCAYERQDRDFTEQGRLCSLGSKWFAMDLQRYGADRVITFAPHSQANIDDWQGVFGAENYYPLQTTNLFATHIGAQFPDTQNLVIGAPDGADKPNDRGIARARELAGAVNKNLQMFKIGKAHVQASETKVTSFEGDVAGKDCVVVDDMSDGGSTLINAAKELKARGAKSVSVYFTHAICSHNSLQKLASNSDIDHIVTTDTVPEIIGKREALEPVLRDKVEVLSVGPQLAQSLQHIMAQGKPATTISGTLDAAGQSHQTQR